MRNAPPARFTFDRHRDHRADGGTVGVSDSRHIQDDARLVSGDQAVDFIFKAGTFGPAVNVALDGERGDSGLDRSLGENQNHVGSPS